MDEILRLNTQTDDATEEKWRAALATFQTEHEEKWHLAELYGEDAKAALVHGLYARLQAQRGVSEKQSVPGWTPAVESAALLVLRTALRERVAVDELFTPAALHLFLDAASETREAHVRAGVSFNGLRCVMNAVGSNPPGLRSFVQSRGTERIIEVLEGGSLTCGSMELALRILLHTSGTVDGGMQALCRGGNLFRILVPTLAWIIRHENPPFPKGGNRASLARMMLKLLFTMRQSPADPKTGKAVGEDDPEMMSELGMLLCDILLLPHKDIEVYDTQLEVVKVLMDMPASFASYIMEQGVIEPLMDIMRFQVERIAVEQIGDPATTVTPVLAVLTMLAEANDEARAMIKAEIFPNPPPEPSPHGPGEEKKGGESNGPSMHPLDAPPFSLRAQLLTLMQAREETAYRTSAELVFALCNHDPDEFVRRAGLGNAAGLLKIKGLFDPLETKHVCEAQGAEQEKH